MRTTVVVRGVDLALARKDRLMCVLSRRLRLSLIRLLKNCYGGLYVWSATSTLYTRSLIWICVGVISDCQLYFQVSKPTHIEEAVIDVITYAVTWSESESTPHCFVIENPKIASS